VASTVLALERYVADAGRSHIVPEVCPQLLCPFAKGVHGGTVPVIRLEHPILESATRITTCPRLTAFSAHPTRHSFLPSSLHPPVPHPDVRPSLYPLHAPLLYRNDHLAVDGRTQNRLANGGQHLVYVPSRNPSHVAPPPNRTASPLA